MPDSTRVDRSTFASTDRRLVRESLEENGERKVNLVEQVFLERNEQNCNVNNNNDDDDDDNND